MDLINSNPGGKNSDLSSLDRIRKAADWLKKPRLNNERIKNLDVEYVSDYDEKLYSALIEIFKELYKFRVMQIFFLKSALALVIISSVATGVYFGCTKHKLFYLLFISTICLAISLLIVFRKFSYEPTLYKKFIDKNNKEKINLISDKKKSNKLPNINSIHEEEDPSCKIILEECLDYKLKIGRLENGQYYLTVQDDYDNITIYKTSTQLAKYLVKHEISGFQII